MANGRCHWSPRWEWLYGSGGLRNGPCTSPLGRCDSGQVVELSSLVCTVRVACTWAWGRTETHLHRGPVGCCGEIPFLISTDFSFLLCPEPSCSVGFGNRSLDLRRWREGLPPQAPDSVCIWAWAGVPGAVPLCLFCPVPHQARASTPNCSVWPGGWVGMAGSPTEGGSHPVCK